MKRYQSEPLQQYTPQTVTWKETLSVQSSSVYRYLWEDDTDHDIGRDAVISIAVLEYKTPTEESCATTNPKRKLGLHTVVIS